VRLNVVMLDEMLEGRLQVADIKGNGEPVFAVAAGAFVDPAFRH
jgi:hypothetical protein